MIIAEPIREQALEGVRDELRTRSPSQVEEMLPQRAATAWSTFGVPLRRARLAEGHVIGPQGSRLRAVGANSGADRGAVGTKVDHDLHVKVAKDWQRDPKQLRGSVLALSHDCASCARTTAFLALA